MGQEAGCNQSILWPLLDCEVNWAHFSLVRIGNTEKQQLYLALKPSHLSMEAMAKRTNK